MGFTKKGEVVFRVEGVGFMMGAVGFWRLFCIAFGRWGRGVEARLAECRSCGSASHSIFRRFAPPSFKGRLNRCALRAILYAPSARTILRRYAPPVTVHRKVTSKKGLTGALCGGNRHEKIPPEGGIFVWPAVACDCAYRCAAAGFTFPFPYSERVLVSTMRYSLTVRVWSSPMAFAAVRSWLAVAARFSFEKEIFDVFPSLSSRKI